MSLKRQLIERWYATLAAAAGPRNWWPGETTDEIIIGAVLTQNTAWSNVEKAIIKLKENALCDIRALAKLAPADFAPLIRSSGYYNLKSVRLHSVAGYFSSREHLLSPPHDDPPTAQLREEMLQVRGVGPETADSILLYAMQRLTFVVDAYTIRVMSRHGLCAPNASYHDVREILQAHAPSSIGHYNEFHALFVWVGHHFCKPTPRCGECPLFRRDCFASEKAWKNMRNPLKGKAQRA